MKTIDDRPAPATPEPAKTLQLPAGAGLEPPLVDTVICYAPELPHIYVSNQKAACSTIKNSLLSKIFGKGSDQINDSSLHRRSTGPFARPFFQYTPQAMAEAARLPMFTVVRNPYTRLLSAYLNKLRPGNPVATRFYRRYLHDPDQPELPSFRQFLEVIAAEHPRRVDPHFRAQYVNTLVFHIDFELVGAMEDMGTVASYLAGYGTELVDWADHATGAQQLLGRYYDDDAIDLVCRIFAEDFEIFGYSRDIAAAGEPPSPASAGGPPAAAGTIASGIRFADYVAAPSSAAQPGTCEIELMRRYRAVLPEDQHAARAEIAVRALDADDWSYVQQFAYAMRNMDEYELCRRLLERVLLLHTRHLDVLPDRFLSARGRELKRRRHALLDRPTNSG
jgi:hypothetical protein